MDRQIRLALGIVSIEVRRGTDVPHWLPAGERHKHGY